MPRVLEVQSTFSSGEAEPRLAERRDVQFYYAALERARNVVVLPQGGFANSPGLVAESQLRNPVTTISLAGATPTAPNGGTAGNAIDGNLSTVLTTSAVSGATFPVLVIDLATPRTFFAVDVINFRAGTAAVDQCFAVQVSTDNATWTTIQTMDLDTVSRSRRFSLPPGQSVLMRYVRLVIFSGAAAGAITVTDVRVMVEGGFTGAVRTVNFNFAKDQEYTLALTPGHGDVFFDGVWQAGFRVDVTAAMLAEIDWATRLDSLLIYHEDLQTPLIKRQGRHTEWDYRPYPFRNLPLYDFGGVYANGVNARQRIQLYGLATGETFDLTLEGETTTAISVDASNGVTANNIEAALEALPNVVNGLTVGFLTATVYDVAFTGGTNAAREWLPMQGTAFDADGVVVVREMVRGKAAGEDVISTTRGWPRTGVFMQQSLVQAGPKSLPLHIMKSETGAPDNFNTALTGATGAMFFELDAGTANEIFKLYFGMRLMAFTSDAAFFLDQDGLSKTETPKFLSTQQPGIKRGLPIAAIEGGLIYVEAAGKIIREMRYSEVKANFEAQNISVLSAHLLNDPVDLAHRRAVSNNANDLIHVINSDGSLIFMTTLRSENVAGFTMRDNTHGQFKAITVNSEQQVRTAIARTTNGVSRLWLERFDDSVVTDAARITTGAGITSIALPASLNGETLHVFCDKAYVGTRVVAAGAIAGLPACDRIEVGFGCLAYVKDMPVLKEEEARQPLARLKRCYGLALSLFETDHVAVEVNDGPTYSVPLMQLGETEIGESIGDRPFTGTIHLEGFPGFTEAGQVSIRQLRPGRLTVRQIRKSVRV